MNRSERREYPYNALGAHVIGFVSVDEYDMMRGQYGVENIFDDVLSGTKRSVKPTVATVLEEIEGGGEEVPILTGNILLTIDINVQREIDRQIKNIQERWNAKKVGAIVLDPNDGRVVAMGSVPGFNPNTYNTVRDYSVFNNSAVEEVYEMGSVFKALTAAIAIDSGSVSPNANYNDRGSVVVDGQIISNYDKRGRGPEHLVSAYTRRIIEHRRGISAAANGHRHLQGLH